MTDYMRTPLARLLAVFEAGVTIDELERRYHARELTDDQLPPALEIFNRAARMTGHDFALRPESEEQLRAMYGATSKGS